VDDVGFVTAVVAAVPGVDPARVYATGISNGGMLAYRLACDTTLFAAIGPDSATQLGTCPSPAAASVIHIHGTADRNIPYDGSPGQGFAHIHAAPVPEVVASWRAVDGCPSPTSTTDGAVTTSVATCPGGRAVELVTIDGAGHQWPGSAPRALGGVLGLDPPSTALDATAVIWGFFSAHPKAG
jgi:polyhydroxybutyrate depolymerase